MRRIKAADGFTLIELLVVIVVIAILAAVSIVAYSGIKDRALAAAIQADLNTANKQLMMYYQENGMYPTANSCPAIDSTVICLKSSQPGVSYVYTPNNSSASPSYMLVATNGSKTYSVSSSSSPGAGISGKTGVSVTNLVTNGNFSAGFNGWVNYCSGPSSCSTSGSGLTLTSVSPGRAAVSQQIPSSYTDQDKVYYGLAIQKISGANFYAVASRTNGGYDSAILTTSQFNSQAAGGFQHYSVVRTFVASQGTGTSVSIGQYNYTFNFSVQVNNLVVINLTKSFGAGNEPSAATMDAMLQQQTPNQYFSGTTTLYK